MRILLDLFCGAGGASAGYYEAGFDKIIGIDINPQPYYPFSFIQGDALQVLSLIDITTISAIHASPPCQGYSPHVSSENSPWNDTKGKAEPTLIPAIRYLLEQIDKPYVIENVMGAQEEMINPIMLCGTMFKLPISRHRLFESNRDLEPLMHYNCRGVAKAYAAKHGWEYRDMSVTGKGRHKGTSQRWAEIMQMKHPMRQHDYKEAIPPAYTNYIGRQLIKCL